MKILVVGATGKTGRKVVERLIAEGHEVTAFARRPEVLSDLSVRTYRGDACEAADVDGAVRGQDAVVVALGITENPLAVRLRGSTGTRIDVRSAGTRNVVAAMRRHGVKKLAVLSSYGVGESRDRLPFKWRMIFSLFLKPQIADTEVQETIVRESDLEWTLVQPVGLTDVEDEQDVLVSASGETKSMAVSRKSVAAVLASSARGAFPHQCVAVSA